MEEFKSFKTGNVLILDSFLWLCKNRLSSLYADCGNTVAIEQTNTFNENLQFYPKNSDKSWTLPVHAGHQPVHHSGGTVSNSVTCHLSPFNQLGCVCHCRVHSMPKLTSWGFNRVVAQTAGRSVWSRWNFGRNPRENLFYSKIWCQVVEKKVKESCICISVHCNYVGLQVGRDVSSKFSHAHPKFSAMVNIPQMHIPSKCDTFSRRYQQASQLKMETLHPNATPHPCTTLARYCFTTASLQVTQNKLHIWQVPFVLCPHGAGVRS